MKKIMMLVGLLMLVAFTGCDDDGSGYECDNGEQRCFEGIVQECNGDAWYDIQDCEGLGGTCQEDEEKGTAQCAGDLVEPDETNDEVEDTESPDTVVDEEEIVDETIDEVEDVVSTDTAVDEDEVIDETMDETVDQDEVADEEPLAIAGDYKDNWDSEHSITDESWIMGESLFHIEFYSNDDEYLIALNDENNEYNPSKYSRFDWTFSGEKLYYCQITYDAESYEDAEAVEIADRNDLEGEGCNGFSWSELISTGE